MDKAAEIIRNGGLVVVPTETAYGLAARVDCTEAIDKLWLFKGDRGRKPVAMVVADVEKARKYIVFEALTEELAEKYWPGAVTMVAKSRGGVDERLVNETGEVGLRVPGSEWLRGLVERVGVPLTATSANISGGETPYSVEKWKRNTPREKQVLVDLVIDGGSLAVRLTSTIVRISGGKLEVVRQGEVVVK